MGKIGWFEILSNGKNEELAKFYSDVFGWKFEKQEMGYEYWMLKNDDEVGMGGGIMDRQFVKSEDKVNGFINTVTVDSVDESAKKIEAAGGKLLAPKHAIPGMGWHAYLTDPEGNVFAIMDQDTSAK